ncbi:hypothetical protein GCM10027160_12150 [Streptomyces calidiresistens]|uniref:LamG domain-containing protein n=1 Tax=Streptomyces calidiresistens TaxID=1485586 RepID=UPI0015FAAB4E|nr:LamG domain-containing protein [Streptomyces calidiresistens]
MIPSRRRGPLVAALTAILLVWPMHTGTAAADPARTAASPPPPPLVTSAEYPEIRPADPEDPWYDGAGRPGEFTFSAPGTTVNRYQYGIRNDPWTILPTENGAPRTITFVPERGGVFFISVRGLTPEGVASGVTTYRFSVASGTSERVGWALDDASDARVASGYAEPRSATLLGGAVLGGDGVRGGALTLNGADALLRTDTRLLDPAADFTVSTWVRLEETGDEPSVVWSLPGREHPEVELFHSPRLDRWILGAGGSERGEGRPTGARSRAPVSRTTGEWVHLVGTHDAVRGELTLYVNGHRTGRTPHAADSSMSRPLLVGAGRYAGGFDGFLHGDVDEITLFERVLSPEEISRLHAAPGESLPGAPASLALALDEPAGGRTVGGGADAPGAELRGGAALGAESLTGTSLALDGLDGHAVVGSLPLNGAADWSFATRVRLDRLPGEEATVFSLTSTTDEAVSVGYDPSGGNWFLRTPGGGNTPAGTTAPLAERWMHLAVVHHAGRDAVELYVNGFPAGTAEQVGVPTGPLSLTLGATDGTAGPAAFLPGRVDDVRLHDRPLPASEIKAMSPPVEDNPPAAVAARWNFEELVDGITPDSSPNGHHLTVVGGELEEFGWVDDRALLLNGVDGHASTDSVPIDTTKGFSVTGFFRSRGLGDEPATVLSVVGERESAVTVRFLPHPEEYSWGEWEVSLTDSDGDDAVTTRFVASDFPSDPSYWTHVAVVYDRSGGALRLYVDSYPTEIDLSSAPTFPAFGEVSSVQIGRSLRNGEWGEYWPGMVDDIWVVDGVLSDHQVRHMAAGASGLPPVLPVDPR